MLEVEDGHDRRRGRDARDHHVREVHDVESCEASAQAPPRTTPSVIAAIRPGIERRAVLVDDLARQTFHVGSDAREDAVGVLSHTTESAHELPVRLASARDVGRVSGG